MVPKLVGIKTSVELRAQTPTKKLNGAGKPVLTLDHWQPSQWRTSPPTAQASFAEILQTPKRAPAIGGLGLRDQALPSQCRARVPNASEAPTAQTSSLRVPESPRRFLSVRLIAVSHSDPFQWMMVPAAPAAQTSSEAAPQSAYSRLSVPLATGSHWIPFQ